MNRQDYARALAHAERAVALDPELGRAYETKGMALWRGGRPLEALARSRARCASIRRTSARWCGWVRFCSKPAGPTKRWSISHTPPAANPMLADAFVGIALVKVQRRRFDDAESAWSERR